MMILEGLVTTTNADGTPHLAPMGPRIDGDTLLLRPFPTSHTFENLQRHRQGVFHLTDDALLMAKGAIGQVGAMPRHCRADQIDGFVLSDACRAFEFRVDSIDTSEQRVRMSATIVNTVSLRDFLGFNRAKHAVLEAAILATRLHLLNVDDVAREYGKFRIIVEKTGGAAEHEAMTMLETHLAEWSAQA